MVSILMVLNSQAYNSQAYLCHPPFNGISTPVERIGGQARDFREVKYWISCIPLSIFGCSDEDKVGKVLFI